ncbi:MAG: adenylate/guanylate cyclase domain-containing protein [Acidimicrobiia bacterium]|nr:adenylate/guanylate cyclase domain-containing protein [Acidimicrobiia bacterium]
MKTVIAPPETRYVKSTDGLHIAYQTLGDGPVDIVAIPTAHAIDALWEQPDLNRFFERVARLGRLILLDYRGFGVSDPVPLGALPTPESWMEDTRVVLDAVEAGRVHVFCHGGSGFLGMLFAATHPKRTATLTLFEASPLIADPGDFPIGIPAEAMASYVAHDEQFWGTPAHARFWAPSRSDDDVFASWSARFERAAQSPAAHTAMLNWVANLDLRGVAPAIRVPTLVLHREHGRLIPPSHASYLEEHIPGARRVTVPGADYWFFTEQANVVLELLAEHITGMPPAADPDRALATVLFTDIVSSTDRAAELGDRRWVETLDRHDEIVNRELVRFRGQKVNPTGDGLLALFDGPARAIRCAQAIRDGVRTLGVEVRAGLHCGEVERRGPDVGGIAVHIGARISSIAKGGEVLVSRTVTDLVAGSGIAFEERGEHELKGVPGTWSLFAVTG